ncbi:MAG: glycerol-3-phosphate 1-O-acyltransferase PlsY [Pseudarcicella sp.]|jgi:glycerol-3-phosphate acyltransferase PlsY|nr:glycerol-3-phosphate 1-O-acyltransferase PlsY [Pseudarcicella sp.]
MLVTILIVVGVIIAYLLGSIPTAVWYSEAYFGIDVRQHGSGNSGATNTFRVLGKRAGIIVLIIDAIKGWMAASLALMLYYTHLIDHADSQTLKLIFGIMAVIGHILPIFSNFEGGKGVATLLGMVISVNALAALVCMAVFLVVFLITNYVSLSSILGSFTYPMLLLTHVFGEQSLIITIFGFVLFLMVVYTHRKNIVRLLKGTESKVYLSSKEKKK